MFQIGLYATVTKPPGEGPEHTVIIIRLRIEHSEGLCRLRLCCTFGELMTATPAARKKDRPSKIGCKYESCCHWRSLQVDVNDDLSSRYDIISPDRRQGSIITGPIVSSGLFDLIAFDLVED